MNVYGTCNHKNNFWEEVCRTGILHYLGLILGSDLNLTLFASKFWVVGNDNDSLAGYISSLFESSILTDMVPNYLVPTWSNGRMDYACITKSIDVFLMSYQFFNLLGRFRSWSTTRGVLQLYCDRILTCYFFNFNHCSLEEEFFRKLVNEKWEELSNSVHMPPMV